MLGSELNDSRPSVTEPTDKPPHPKIPERFRNYDNPGWAGASPNVKYATKPADYDKQVPAAIANLESSVNRLDSLLEDLTTRLKPVLGRSPRPALGAGVTTDFNLLDAPVALAITLEHSKVLRAIESIKLILDLLEV